MEDLVRLHHEYDRLVLAWLRSHVGDGAIRTAARRVSGGDDRKPYLSTVCRALGVQAPSRRTLLKREASRRAVGDHYLREIRAILARPKAPAQEVTAPAAA